MMHEKGLYTVEDFINCDIDDNFNINKQAIIYYRGMKDILKYKYLGISMTSDILFEKEFSKETFNNNPLGSRTSKKDFLKTMLRLCVFSSGNTIESLRNYFIKNIVQNDNIGEQFTVIDFIKSKKDSLDQIELPTQGEKGALALYNFLVAYYNKEVKAKNELTVVADETVDTLDSLKNELLELVNQKKKLDDKINILLEKINIMEEGKKINEK